MVTEGRGETVGGVSVDGEEFELPNFIVTAQGAQRNVTRHVSQDADVILHLD